MIPTQVALEDALPLRLAGELAWLQAVGTPLFRWPNGRWSTEEYLAQVSGWSMDSRGVRTLARAGLIVPSEPARNFDQMRFTATPVRARWPLDESLRSWFSGSHVVDASGAPLVVYHGTGVAADFKTFRSRGDTVPYFTPIPATAGAYAIGEEDDPTPAPRIIPVYLSIRNPLVTDEPTLQSLERQFGRSVLVARGLDDSRRSFVEQFQDSHGGCRDLVLEEAKHRGHDGLILPSDMSPISCRGGDWTLQVSYVPFSADQIRFAIGARALAACSLSAGARASETPPERSASMAAVASTAQRRLRLRA